MVASPSENSPKKEDVESGNESSESEIDSFASDSDDDDWEDVDSDDRTVTQISVDNSASKKTKLIERHG